MSTSTRTYISRQASQTPTPILLPERMTDNVSGFFGGLTLRRIRYTRRLKLIIWLVPSLMGGGVAISFLGVLLGPIYPIVTNHTGRILPPRLLAGSAIPLFITGAVTSTSSIKGLRPLLVLLKGLMVVLWALVPSMPRRME